jgi:hypothetical protein
MSEALPFQYWDEDGGFLNTNSSKDKKSVRISASVRIGVTGHRQLVNELLLRNSVKKILARIDEILNQTPHTFIVISPLAEGADRLVAKEVLDWQVSAEVNRLEVVLPLPESDYFQDFSTQESKDEFKTLLAKAMSVRTLDKAESRTEAYERVGHYVVKNCDLLIAIWDGKDAAGQGGTAEIVKYAQKAGRSFFWINSENGKIKEEKLKDHALESLKHLNAYNQERLNAHDLKSAVDQQYDNLADHAIKSGLALDYLKHLRENLLSQFVRADSLALHYQSRHMTAESAVYILSAAAVATVTVQVLFFPQYPQLLWFEVAWIGGILLLLLTSYATDSHRKWIDYRFLAERLRAAFFLCVTGIRCEPPRPPPYLMVSHRPDDWMVRAFAWLWDLRSKRQTDSKIEFAPLKNFLVSAWIEDQISFYTKTGERHGRKHNWYARTGEILFALTLVVAIVHTTGFGESSLPASFHLPNILASMAIILPAAGASLAGIRVHREYLKNAERYSHMAEYLSSIRDQIEHASRFEELTGLLEKANEVMLRENQDWRIVFVFQKLEAP